MNTAKLKRFAQDARKKLLEQIAAKLEYVLSADTAELREKAAQVRALKDELGTTGKAVLAEKVAYTWFNRLVALRFLDVNGYQPLDLRVISPKDGYSSPELLDEAKQDQIPEELKVDSQRVLDLLDGRVPSTNPQNEAYHMLLIAACNHLHTVLPFLFERINDYTELLLPDDLTSELSILHDVREGMTAEDCQQVEIIGWLYQFYISEKKDEVFASKAKVKKEDIPAATQLFTPRWIVEYMVQNTVGKLWLQNRPASRLREHMPYFIESASLQSNDYLRIGSPQELTLLDQACGSGHILVYGFELLAKIYEEEGYSPSEIPQLILAHNLFGFEIDERAAQLAAMALMMKARSYQRRLFKKGQVPQPRILCFQDLKLDERQLAATLAGIGIKHSNELLHDLNNMRQATNLGSLIVPHAGTLEISLLLTKIEEQQQTSQADLFGQYELLQIKSALSQLKLLGQKYTCVVDNPPYMGSGNMNAPLADFVKRKYPNSKADLMACFMESGLAMLQPNGFLGMINQEVWMFKTTYQNLRKWLAAKASIDTMLHLGTRVFKEISGDKVRSTSFVVVNTPNQEIGLYYKLTELKDSHLKEKAILSTDCQKFFFKKGLIKLITESNWAYWLTDNGVDIIKKSKPLNSFSEPKKGTTTGKDDYFLKLWHEISLETINFTQIPGHKILDKWFPVNKGGGYRKWYGLLEYVIMWENDGKEIRAFKGPNGKLLSRPQNLSYNFKEGVTWTSVSSTGLTCRYSNEGMFMTDNGATIFNSPNHYITMAVLNSKVGDYFLSVLTPGFKFDVGVINKFPINPKVFDLFENSLIDLSTKNVAISMEDWNSNIFSWDFKTHELLRFKSEDIIESYDLYTHYWRNKFFKLHENEIEINRRLIDVYGLQNELTPSVPLEQITILQQETSIENGQLVFHAREVMAQFVSYAVGCMFGRYSLDLPGLILANQGETLEDYLRKVGKDEQEVAFLPDADNIVPVLDGDWYADDITGRFQDFLKATFGADNLAKNLAFVQECLGKDIRKYFVKDFYTDHVQRYKKRPIYWMFSSPQGSFNALVYLHRYTPDTVNTLLNKYLRDYLEKLRTRREHLVRVEVDGAGAGKAQAAKEKDALDKVLLELQDYERNVLYPLATERIALDLDHGVLVNYNRFGTALRAVPGLNDAKAQKQVREFDWVETPTTA